MNRFAVLLALAVCPFLASPLFAITRTWTGSVNANWSVAGNWSPPGIPTPEDNLVFPANSANKNMMNDLPPGTSVGPMFFQAAPLNGNLLTLTGSVFGLWSFADLRLGASITVTGSSEGTIDINGKTLSTNTDSLRLGGIINGEGTIVSQVTLPPGVTLYGSGNFSGTIRGGQFGGGLLLQSGTFLPNATVDLEFIQQFAASATLGDVTIRAQNSAYISAGSGGVLHTKSLTLSHAFVGAAGGGLRVSVNPTGSGQIDVLGAVTLNGAPLDIFPSGTLVPGQTFTIINNEGVDPINGIFAELPEGAIAGAGSTRFRISYVGGDGNDVVLTTLADTSSTISQNANATVLGEPLTMTATVTAKVGTPTGSVVFMADGVPIGNAPVQNGIATLTVTTLNSGTHAIAAAFVGSGIFSDSVSAGISHEVTRWQTQTTIAASQPNVIYGNAARFTVTVIGQPPMGGQPTGSVTVFADALSLGVSPVLNGTATFETSALHAGVKSITATYSGDASFATSIAPAIQQSISKAQTEVDVRSRTLLVGEPPLITVFVNVVPGSSIVPTGSVTLSESGAVVVAQALAGGAATFSLSPLAVGDHTFAVKYSGDTDFEASSATIVQSVVAPSVSIYGTRVLEGNLGVTTVSLVVSLSSPVSQPVRVSFSTVAGSATEGEDYERTSGVIEFAPGELMRAIEIHVIGDTFPESDETSSVLLSNPINATIDTPSAVIVIGNDDQAPPRRRSSRH